MAKKTAKKEMPKLVQQAVGQVQQRWSHLEGQARQVADQTWTRLQQAQAMQRIQTTWSQLRTRTDARLSGVDKLRRRAERFTNQVSDRAAHTVGLVTQSDLRGVVRQLDRLRADVRKLVGGGTRKRAAK